MCGWDAGEGLCHHYCTRKHIHWFLTILIVSLITQLKGKHISIHTTQKHSRKRHFQHQRRLTWVVLWQARQGLCRVHTNIIFGEDDLAIQARAQRRAPRPGVKGQEVGGLGGGTPQEPTQRHLLRHRDTGPILWRFGRRKGRQRRWGQSMRDMGVLKSRKGKDIRE